MKTWCCWTARRWSAAGRWTRPGAAAWASRARTIKATVGWFGGMRLHLLAAPDGTPRVADPYLC